MSELRENKNMAGGLEKNDGYNLSENGPECMVLGIDEIVDFVSCEQRNTPAAEPRHVDREDARQLLQELSGEEGQKTAKEWLQSLRKVTRQPGDDLTIHVEEIAFRIPRLVGQKLHPDRNKNSGVDVWEMQKEVVKKVRMSVRQKD